MRVAIIPARGGSKRIPGKNIRPFFGKPIIAWSISAALASKQFDRVVVSTDDEAIAGVSRQAGAEVPFVRPANLSDDHATTTAVITHAVEWLAAEGTPADFACCIYATAPFLQAADLAAGFARMASGAWQYVFSATDFAAPVSRAFEMLGDGGLRMFNPELFSARSQDLPRALHDAGQFYWGRAEAWRNGLRIFDTHSTAVVLPRWRVQDIDDLDDWSRAEQIFALMHPDRREA